MACNLQVRIPAHFALLCVRSINRKELSTPVIHRPLFTLLAFGSSEIAC